MKTLCLTLLLVSSAAGQTPAGCIDQSDVRPPVTAADIRIAHRARQILNSPAKWNRADTRECPATETTFSLYCALEKATQEIAAGFTHRGAAMQEARFVIEDVSPKAKDYDHRLMDYNNDPNTSFADIRKVLALLETRISKKLKDQKQHPQAVLPECPPQAPPLKEADLRIIDCLRELLNSEAGWNRADTQDCPRDASKVSLYCAFVQAEREINATVDDTQAIDETRTLIGETAPNRAKYKGRLMDYNNDPEVSLEDVQQLLRTVREQLAQKLPR